MASVCEARSVRATCTTASRRPPRPRWRRSPTQIELAPETLLDFKSALQEQLAREGLHVTYEVSTRLDRPTIGASRLRLGATPT